MPFPSLSLPGFHYVAQFALELEILLLMPPKSWDYSHVPPCPANCLFSYYTTQDKASPTYDHRYSCLWIFQDFWFLI
jgi:hypothetical protein